MESFIKYQRIILLIVIVVSLVLSGVLFYFLPKQWDYAAGILWGSLGGIIILRLKVLAIYKFSQNSQAAPVKIGFQANALMIGFLVAAIAINFYIGNGSNIFNVWTTLAGLVLPNVVLMIDGFFRPPVQSDVTDTEK